MSRALPPSLAYPTQSISPRETLGPFKYSWCQSLLSRLMAFELYEHELNALYELVSWSLIAGSRIKLPCTTAFQLAS
jgi:hypothetical protein